MVQSIIETLPHCSLGIYEVLSVAPRDAVEFIGDNVRFRGFGKSILYAGMYIGNIDMIAATDNADRLSARGRRSTSTSSSFLSPEFFVGMKDVFSFSAVSEIDK